MNFDVDYATIFFLSVALGAWLTLCWLATKRKPVRLKSRYWKR